MSPVGVIVRKQFQYRGATEEYANKYWLTGDVPADNAAWLALCDAVALSERGCYPAEVKVVGYYGYATPGGKSVFQYDFAALARTFDPGTTQSGSNVQKLAGDQATQIRALCGQSSKGRNKYLRKYFHGGFATTNDPDNVDPTHVTKLGVHATTMTAGTLPGGRKWCSPTGQVGTFPYVPRQVTTRSLKRRGRRPSS